MGGGRQAPNLQVFKNVENLKFYIQLTTNFFKNWLKPPRKNVNSPQTWEGGGRQAPNLQVFKNVENLKFYIQLTTNFFKNWLKPPGKNVNSPQTWEGGGDRHLTFRFLKTWR